MSGDRRARGPLPPRAYCLFHRHGFPTRYPANPRPDLALRRPTVVAMRDGEELLCGGEHDGPHAWPDGDLVDDGPAAAADAATPPDADPPAPDDTA